MKSKNKVLFIIGWILGLSVILSGLNLLRLNMKIDEINSKVSNKEYITVKELVEADIYELASSIYNVPTYLIKAIERHETGNYSSDLFINKNNTFGCKQSNGSWCNFDSTDQSTLELARTLAFKYKVKNEYYNLEHIADEFCAEGCDSWLTGITNIIKEEKGSENS